MIATCLHQCTCTCIHVLLCTLVIIITPTVNNLLIYWSFLTEDLPIGPVPPAGAKIEVDMITAQSPTDFYVVPVSRGCGLLSSLNN